MFVLGLCIRSVVAVCGSNLANPLRNGITIYDASSSQERTRYVLHLPHQPGVRCAETTSKPRPTTVPPCSGGYIRPHPQRYKCIAPRCERVKYASRQEVVDKIITKSPNTLRLHFDGTHIHSFSIRPRCTAASSSAVICLPSSTDRNKNNPFVTHLWLRSE